MVNAVLLHVRTGIAPARAPKAVYSETYYPRIHLGWSELRSLIRGRNQYIDGPRPELYDMASDDPRAFDAVVQEFNDQQMLPVRMKAQSQPTMQQQQQIQPKKEEE